MDDLLALMDGGGDEDSLSGSEQQQHFAALSSPSSPSNSTTTTTTNNNNNNINNTTSSPCVPSSRVSPASSQNYSLTLSKTNNKKKKSMTETVATKVDRQLGIRMMERKIGSLELLEMVQTSNYHSPAVLAAMSLETLNKQLVEPALVVGPANVCGNTSLLTIGIVFENSGTKIAAKGNAFCVLSIGSNLQSGTCVSVLLFGQAYSKYCKEVKPGMVIALDSPRLIPPKLDDGYNKKFQKNDTTITFTINDERHLIVVAKAKDYGVCQAMVKGKNANGHWVNNAKRCSTAIDTRAGKYCFQHRKLENDNVNNTIGMTSNNQNSNKPTFLQQHRRELNKQPLRTDGKPLLLPNNKNSILAASAVPLLITTNGGTSCLQGVPRQMSKNVTTNNNNLNSTQSLARPKQPQRADGLRRSIPNAVTRPINNSILNASVKGSTSKNTKKKPINPNPTSPDSIVRPTREQTVINKSSTNRILNPSMMTATTNKIQQISSKNPSMAKYNPSRAKENAYAASNRKKSPKPQQNQDHKSNVVLDWLSDTKTKKTRKNKNSTSSNNSSTNRKIVGKPKLNTVAMGGFDGSVIVPKPSKLFASNIANSSCLNQSLSSVQQMEEQLPPNEGDILSKQSMLAEQFKNTQKNSAINKDWGRGNEAAKEKKNNSSSTSAGSFFDSALVKDNAMFQNLDRESMLIAKSRFASEADAEAYAARRKRVIELEQEEARKEEKNQAKNNCKDGSDSKNEKKIVGKEWICRTCNNKIFKMKPMVCFRDGHSVVSKRTLNKTEETVADKRIKLSTTSVQDGGLRLGMGIEWSRLNYSRFS